MAADWLSNPCADPVWDAPVAGEWYNLPYVNQSSWALALLALERDPDPHNAQIAREAGHIALRVATGRPEVPENPFAQWGLKAFPQAFEASDLKLSCRFLLYQVAEGPRALLIFVPAEVEVRCLQALGVEFWPGSVAALARLARQRRQALNEPSGPDAPDPLADGDAAPVPLADGDAAPAPLADGDAAAPEEDLPWVRQMEIDAEHAAILGDAEVPQPAPAPRRRRVDRARPLE